jgi:hypothetical protein
MRFGSVPPTLSLTARESSLSIEVRARNHVAELGAAPAKHIQMIVAGFRKLEGDVVVETCSPISTHYHHWKHPWRDDWRRARTAIAWVDPPAQIVQPGFNGYGHREANVRERWAIGQDCELDCSESLLTRGRGHGRRSALSWIEPTGPTVC